MPLSPDSAVAPTSSSDRFGGFSRIENQVLMKNLIGRKLNRRRARKEGGPSKNDRPVAQATR